MQMKYLKKENQMKISKISSLYAVGLFFLTAVALAQPGMGAGSGAGPGASGSPGAGSGYYRSMQFDENNATGWSLMTNQEKRQYRERMMASKTFDECLGIQKQNHEQMMTRAKSQGVNLSSPRQNACERMRERDFYK